MANSWPTSMQLSLLFLRNLHFIPQLVIFFCPISLLSLSSKLLETAIFPQLTPLINSALSPRQSGFRSGHSTESLLSLSCDIFHHFSHHRSVLLVLLDMSSAFDLVDHFIFLDDLSCIGLSSSALSVLKSYFNNRTYCVKFNSTYSDRFPVTSGVPQGSTLVLYYLIYICPPLPPSLINFQSLSTYMLMIFSSTFPVCSPLTPFFLIS